MAALGISAEHVGDLGMAAATDEAILKAARDRGAVVATLDADFHRILAMSNEASPSVIRLRLSGLKGDQFAALLAKVLEDAAAEVAAGALISVASDRMRIRLLPIVRKKRDKPR